MSKILQVSACLTLLTWPFLSAAASGPEDPSWSLGLYGEGDGESGVGFAADLTWFASDRTQLYAGAMYSDTTTGITGLSTSGFSLGGYHDFGPVGVDLWYDAWRDPDVVDTRSINGSFDIEAGQFTFSVQGQLRQSDFEPFNAVALVTLRSGQQIPVAAIADCSLDNTGVGLRVSYAGERVSSYVRAMTYDYADADCAFSSPALDLLERTRPRIFAQFAGAVTGPLAANASSRIGSENALLDRLWATGISYRSGRLEYGLDYLNQRDFFDGLSADTLSVTVNFSATPTLDWYVSTGATDSDVYGSTWFGGLGLRTLF